MGTELIKMWQARAGPIKLKGSGLASSSKTVGFLLRNINISKSLKLPELI